MLLANWLQSSVLIALIVTSFAGMSLYLHRVLRGQFDFVGMVIPICLGFYLSTVMMTGIFSLYSGWFQSLLLIPGLAYALVGFRFRGNVYATIRSTLIDPHLFWIVLPALYFLARIFSAGLPQQHSDGLYYHMVAAKQWAVWNQIRLEETHPSWAQSTLVETAYGLPFLWLKNSGLSTNVTAQIFAQWFQMLFGQLLSVLIGARILKTYLGTSSAIYRLENKYALLFVSWLCICLPCLEWTGALSKTDYTLLMFIMAGFYAVQKKHYIAAGFLMGFAFQTKIFALWAILGLLVYIPVKSWFKFGISTFVAMAPVLIKNYKFTGNPLFPALDHIIGPHWISDAWNKANATFVGLPTFNTKMFLWYWQVALEGKTPKLFLALGTFATIIILVFKHKNKFIQQTNEKLSSNNLIIKDLIFFIVQVAGCMAILRPVANGRYSASATILLFLVLWARIIYLGRSNYLKKNHLPVAMVFALGFLINIPVDLLIKVPRNYLFSHREKYLEQFHPNYAGLKWLNNNTSHEANIYFNTDKVNFYLDRNYEIITEMAQWETKLTKIDNLRDLLLTLKDHGFSHAQFYFESRGYAKLDPYPKKLFDSDIRPAYSNDKEYIYDLSKL